MKLFAILLGYLTGAAMLFGGLAIGVLWLIRPDDAASRTITTPPIPARIAESIERKRAPLPQPGLASAPALAVATVTPVLHEAPASLTPAPNFRARKADRSAHRKYKRAQMRELVPPTMAAEASPPSAPPALPRMVRTDFPY